MRSAGTFATILAAGVLIVLIYQWSGDSIIVLIMCLLTLFALLALWERKPWQALPDDEGPDGRVDDGDLDDGHDRYHDGHDDHQYEGAEADSAPGSERAADDRRGPDPDRTAAADQRGADRAGPAPPITEESPVWRCRFDVALDENGVTGLPLGEREPRLWPWETVLGAGVGWSQAIAEGNAVTDRVALHLAIIGDRTDGDLAPASRRSNQDNGQDGGGAPDLAQLMIGANQHPGAVLGAVRRGMKTARVQRSKFYNLSPAERTRKLANALSPEPITLTRQVISPELLYQDARRTLLTNRMLRRISKHANAEQVLVAVEQLLTAHGALDLDTNELGALGAAADRGDIETVYLGADRVAEARGFRLAFIHHGGDDHLLGLVAFDDASDWDGQTVGSGLTTISLAPPVYS